MSTRTCAQLLEELDAAAGPARKLRFAGVGDRDVYNTTAPFVFNGERLLAGRVEGRDTELSEVLFFAEDGHGVWRPRPGAPSLPYMQDPCVAFFDGEMVLGCVEVEVGPEGKITGWSMPFFRGHSLEELRGFARGPARMKDIRLGRTADGRIGVATRPQGAKGGRGTIGFVVLDRLEDLGPDVLQEAPLLEGQFVPQEWGGANELHLLADGRFGVLGHIACFGAGEPPAKHYYPMVFCLDPETLEHTPVRLIGTRGDFPPGTAKRPDLEDVVFSGGLLRGENGRAEFYAGIGDAEAACLELADPFLRYERGA